MLEIDKNLIKKEEKALIRDAKKWYKLRDQGVIFKKITSPKFYLSEIRELFQKNKAVRLSALVPVIAGAVVGVGGSLTGMVESGSALVFAGTAVSNGILVGGMASLSVAGVKIAGKVENYLKQLKGYNSVKAKARERKLICSMRDRHLKIKQLEELFSENQSSRKPENENSSVRVVKRANVVSSQRVLKENTRE